MSVRFKKNHNGVMFKLKMFLAIILFDVIANLPEASSSPTAVTVLDTSPHSDINTINGAKQNNDEDKGAPDTNQNGNQNDELNKHESTTVPESPKSTTVPESPKSTTDAVSPKSTTVPESPKSTTVPKSPKSTTDVVSPKSTTVPESPKSTTVPESPKSSTVHESSQSTTFLSTKRTTVLQSSKGTTVAESPKSTTVPERSETTTVSKSPETTTVPDLKTTTTVECNTSPISFETDDDIVTGEHNTGVKTTPEPELPTNVSRIRFDSIRLPQSVRPSIYEITIKPYIYVDTGKPYTYDCSTIINITCMEDTDVIKLHSVLHDILSVRIVDIENNVKEDAVYFQLDTPTGMLGILLKRPLAAGKNYTLLIESTSVITDALQGFYRSPYKVGNQTRYIMTTMMEPTDARMVFPCFDEPDFKAIFLFNIYRKAGLTSLTNLPKRVTIGPDDGGFYLDIFDQPRNVPMSTYLVAIAIGDLDYREEYVRDIRFRTYSRSNAAHLTDFSLEIAIKTHEFFEDYFKVAYPLPKQDMIAVPTMSFNAMEHWGLITYREDSMLFEPGVSSALDKEWTAVLIAHEISHQWFGNIVSPKWWDELWLNEGFATYMMMLSIDKLLPDWEIMTKMPVDYRGTQSVFGVDDTLSSHPVYVPVQHPNEIGEIFDLISYAKGSAVIRMMNFILGDKTFRDGLTQYLIKYSYTTATHVDLWNSLSEQAIEDNNTVTDVGEIMDTWIKEMNYPVVTVNRNAQTVCVRQFAFLLIEEERQNRSHVFWDIPFTYTTDVQPSFTQSSRDIVWMRKDGAEVCFEDESISDAQWVLGNIQQYGYYRVNYDIENWQAILRQLTEDHTVFHPINRAQIINDAWNLASAGLLDFEIALGTFDYLDEELHFVPWKAAISNLEYIERSLQLTPIYGEFKEFFKKKIKKGYFNSAGASTHSEKTRYTMLGYEACRYGLQECVDDAMNIFNQWMSNTSYTVDPDMKATVYCTGVTLGGAKAWNFVLNSFLHSDSSTERRSLVEALACTEEPWLLSKLSQMILYYPSTLFLSTDKMFALGEMASTPVGRLMAWNTIEEHWDLLFELYGAELNLFPRLLKAVTKSFNLPYELQRLERLAEDKRDHSEAGPRLFSGALSHVRANIRWIEAHYAEVVNWIHRGI